MSWGEWVMPVLSNTRTNPYAFTNMPVYGDIAVRGVSRKPSADGNADVRWQAADTGIRRCSAGIQAKDSGLRRNGEASRPRPMLSVRLGAWNRSEHA